MKSKSRSARLWSLVEYVGYCLGGGVLLIFLAEIIATLLPYQPPSSRLLVEFINPEWRDEFVYRLDPDLFWCFRPGVVLEEHRRDGSSYGIRLNNLGFRGGDYPDPAAEGAYRIMMVGDSCAFGVLTEEGQNLPEQLVEMLEQAHPDRRSHLMNLGVPGYSSQQARITLQMHGPMYHPNLVVLYSGNNDVLPRVRFPDREILEKHRGELRRQGRLEKSKLFATVRGLLHPGPAGSQPKPADFAEDASARVSLVESRENFTRMIDFVLQNMGARLVVVLPPNLMPDHRIREVNAMVARLCQEKGVPCVDAWSLFAGSSDPRALYSRPQHDKVHPNAAGYGLIAQQVFAVVQDQHWIDGGGVSPTPVAANGQP